MSKTEKQKQARNKKRAKNKNKKSNGPQNFFDAVINHNKYKKASDLRKPNFRPIPEELTIYDDEDTKVESQESSYTCMLAPDAIAVYDYLYGNIINGRISDIDLFTECILWFNKHEKEHFIGLLSKQVKELLNKTIAAGQ
jgi:hypothetical protein